MTSIGFYAFDDCTSLTSINVDADNPSFSDISGVLFNKPQTDLLRFPEGRKGSYTIPDGITEIAEYAFYGSRLTSIIIPNSVTRIERSAFVCCRSLTSISIPSSVTSIGDYAFTACQVLNSVYIPSSVTSIGDFAFYGTYSSTIYGASGSYAEEYAIQNSVPFNAVNFESSFNQTDLSGSCLSVSATIHSDAGVDIGACVFVAVYDGSRLIGLKYQPVIVAANDDTQVDFTLDLSEVPQEYTAKMFIWDCPTTMVQLGEPETANKSMFSR